MLAMMLKPQGRVIDGVFVGRGQWVNITSSKTFDGFFVANIFVRGGGKGSGGDADVGNAFGQGLARGQYGSHAAGNTFSSQIIAGISSVTIGAPSLKGVSDLYFGPSGASGADSSDGGTTSITNGVTTRSALGGKSFGKGGFVDNINTTKSAWDTAVTSITNPNGGDYGRMGGRIGASEAAALAGVVQIQLVD